MLTERRRQLLRRCAYGMTRRQIARDLGVSDHTVNAMLENIYRAIGVRSRTEAAVWAIRHGLVDLPTAYRIMWCIARSD